MRKRRRKSRFPLLLCLCAVLCVLVGARSCNDSLVSEEQVTGKLEKPVVTVPAVDPRAETQASEQVTEPEEEYDPAWDMPARAARFVNINMTDTELEELAKIVFLEAGNQCAEGQQAVVEVVFNRVLHSSFPDTVHDVLHEGEGTSCQQFSTIGMLDAATPTQEQYDAIYNALYGDTILDADVVFFSRNGENNRVWGKIGDHVFCREYIWE